MGHDDRESLGDLETGAHAALPVWMDFMKAAIADKPNEMFPGDIKQLPGNNFARDQQSPAPSLLSKTAAKPAVNPLPAQARSADRAGAPQNAVAHGARQ